MSRFYFIAVFAWSTINETCVEYEPVNLCRRKVNKISFFRKGDGELVINTDLGGLMHFKL